MPTKKSSHYLPYLAYYLTLSIYLLSGWLISTDFFGFTALRYTPGITGFILLAIAFISPILVFLFHLFKPTNELPENKSNSSNFFIYISSLLVVLFGALFIVFRCRTFFLGDSYTVLAEFSKSDIIIKYRELGAYLLQMNLRDLLGEPSREISLLSFQISSITAGILFLISLSWIALRLFDKNRDRLLFWIGLAGGSYMLNFFGYVEFYAWFILSTALFSFTGLLICRGSVNRWIILIPLALAIFMHSLGLVLIPAAVYLLIKNRSLDKYLDRASAWKLSLLSLAAMILGYISIMLFSYIYPFFKFAFLPVVANIITIDNYTLFSAAHLFDYINLLFLLFPGLAVAIILIFSEKDGQFSRIFRFLMILVVSSLFTIFVIDPKLGMPRDWDLLSFTGLPLSLLIFYTAIKNTNQRSHLSMIAPLMILLGLMSLSGRVLSQTDPISAEAQFKDYLKMDSAKSRNGHLILIDYYEKKGDLVSAALESNNRKRLFPQEEMLRQAMRLVEQKKYPAATDLLYQAIKIDPQYWNLWLSLGSVYLDRKNYDSAKVALDIAEGLNPHSATVKAQLGYYYYDNQNYSKAEQAWLEALDLDSELITALMGLASLYHEQNKITEHVTYLSRAAASPDANFSIVANLAEYYISVRNFQRAGELYKRALTLGLDSATYQQIIEKYPQLVQ